MVTLINQARAAAGQPMVAVSQELTAAAQAHARDMAANGYMEHVNRAGLDPQQRAAKAGYAAPQGTAWLVLEVITARATPEAGANWLLADRQHRGVVLRNYFREIGVGFVAGGPWGQIWAIKFGCRPNVLPVLAEPNANGGVTVRLTNEECTPTGGSGQIGKATEVMVSDRNDFNGATWEPFVSTKVVQNNGNVFVRYRDRAGRETEASAGNGTGTVPLSALTTEDSMTISVPGFTPGAAGTDGQSPATAAPTGQTAQPAIINSTSSSTFVETPRR